MRAALLAAALLITACGNDDALRISAAASLKTALPEYEPDARYSFAGSGELASQIRAGARPDVFASADPHLPRALHADGLVERPAVFATNRLVIAVPSAGTKVHSPADLADRGVRLAIAADGAPAGVYTRRALERLPRGRAIAANVRSSEPDVSGVVGKLTQGAVDAGFVYATDVLASGGRLRAIELPFEIEAEYAAAVVRGSGRAEAARAFVTGLRDADALYAAGFGRP